MAQVSSAPNRRLDWRWIARTFLLRKPALFGLFGTTLAIFGVTAAVPVLLQQAIDRIIGGSMSWLLLWFAAAALVATIAEAALTALRQHFVFSLSALFDRRMYRRLSLRLLRARLDGERLPTGETLNRLNQVSRIRSFLLFVIPPLSLTSGSAVVALAIMLWYDWIVALATLATSASLALLVSRFQGRTTSAAFAQQAAEGARQSIVAETLNAMPTIKALSLEGPRFARWSRLTDAANRAFQALMKLSTVYIVGSQVTGRTLTVVILCIGCYRVATGALSVGELLALQLLAGYIMAPLINGATTFTQYREAAVALANLKHIVETPAETTSRMPPLQRLGDGGLEVAGLTLRYPGRPLPALDDVTFTLPARGVFAIVGRNGSGKSTLVRTLLGLQRDFEGSVLVAGNDVLAYAPRWLRRRFAVVNQDAVLLTGSIRDNVARGIADEAQVMRALERADALPLVESLPDGLDTVIQEGARNLSGGQRQRLIIARALFGDPPFLILDEPTAFLDPEAAVALERRLSAFGADRLVLLVTHHLSAITNADGILVMQDGRLIAQGRHDELLASCAHYASLWADYNRTDLQSAA